jgi:hypothetical protein
MATSEEAASLVRLPPAPAAAAPVPAPGAPPVLAKSTHPLLSSDDARHTDDARHPDAIVQDTEQDPTPQKDDPHQDLFGIKIWTATMEIWIVRDIEM